MFTKHSGAVLFGIPLIVAGLAPQPERRRALKTALMAVIAAGLLVFPYYLFRYYVKTGELFPSNSSWMINGLLSGTMQWRHDHPLLFSANFFFGTPQWSDSIVPSSIRDIRLWNAWRQFWAVQLTFKWGSIPELLYLALMFLLCAAGLWRFLRRPLPSQWRRFGLLMLSLSALFFVAFLYYLTGKRYGGWGPSKALYVAPAVWGAAFLLTEVLLPLCNRWKRLGERMFFQLLLLIALVEAIMPLLR